MNLIPYAFFFHSIFQVLPPPLVGTIYRTHATRALQSQAGRERIDYGSNIHSYFFDYTRTWKASLDK
ncbi:hypothetical protein C0J52_26933 [Blattella germanica]|nr:hypothetical protein C0J52_26933 [Blattella germanica]